MIEEPITTILLQINLFSFEVFGIVLVLKQFTMTYLKFKKHLESSMTAFEGLSLLVKIILDPLYIMNN